jgi:hypothetical protein
MKESIESASFAGHPEALSEKAVLPESSSY